MENLYFQYCFDSDVHFQVLFGDVIKQTHKKPSLQSFLLICTHCPILSYLFWLKVLYLNSKHLTVWGCEKPVCCINRDGK